MGWMYGEDIRYGGKGMLKRYAWILLTALFLLYSCGGSSKEEKLVAIGDSSTMGIMDLGLKEDFQLHTYPYFIACQLGIEDDFQQPLVREPGIGVYPYKTPITLQNGTLVAEYWDENLTPEDMAAEMLPLLKNVMLDRPYDNLAVNGARLYDIRRTTGSINSVSPDNYFFDIVLRNVILFPYPHFGGTTVLDQALELDPDIILLWIGNNDVLGAVLAGGDQGQITTHDDFKNEMQALLSDLTSQTRADIVMSNIPGYLPLGFALDTVFVNTGSAVEPVVFDMATLQPVNFGTVSAPEYIPLLIDESDLSHILLTGAIEYSENGMGIPKETQLEGAPYSKSTEAAAAIYTKMTDIGLPVTGSSVGDALTGEYTITSSEEQAVDNAIADFDSIISELAAQFGIPVVDMHALYDPNSPGAFGGYSGEYVLHNQGSTVFSLDGVHPNNLGHAVIANAFINALNQGYGFNLAKIDPETYKGQYIGLSDVKSCLHALMRLGW